MPGTLPVYNPKANDDDERKERNKDIDRFWALRDGLHHKPLAVKPGENDDNIILNVSGQIVDDIVEFMGVPKLTTDDNNADVETLIEQVSDSNDFAVMCQDALESGLIAGHVFMRVALDDDGTPLMSPVDPRFVSVFWDVTRPSLKRALLWYRLTWQVENTTYRQDIVPDWLLRRTDGQEADPRDNAAWWIIEYVKTRQKVEFTEQGRDEWAYPFAPMVDWKNRRRPHQYYGWSEYAGNAEGLQNAINFIASNTGRIIKFHAHPKTIITGSDIDKLQTGPDGLFSFADNEVKVENLEMQSDLSSSMAMLDKLMARYFSERRVVDPASIKDKAGALTNFGLEVMYLNMLKLLKEKQDFYGSGIAETMRRALALLGQDVQIECEWDDPLPVNRLELVNAASTEADIGTTSKETLAGDLGRDYQAEKEKIEEEQSSAVDRTALTMARLAERGGQFGAAQMNGGQPTRPGQTPPGNQGRR